jgi:hypothetical protein
MTVPDHRLRIAAFWIFVIACLAGTIGYVRLRSGSAATAAPPDVLLLNPLEATVAARLADMRTAPHVLFLSTRAEAPGLIGLAPLASPDSQTLFQSELCERAYFTRSQGVCLVLNRTSPQPRAFLYFLDPRFQTVSQLPLAGLPIRARISPDERYAATTVFVTGENYASEDFTTRTTIFDLATRTAVADLERFTVERNGAPFRNTDFNFWGVTFRSDGNRFLATLGTGGRRLLVDGDLQRRHFRVIADDVECPSLSPDQHTIVFKRQKSRGAGWQLWGMDLTSGQSWPVTQEGREVDDQVEWLDESHVIYGMVAGTGLPEHSLSVWVSDARPDAGMNQRLFLQSAWSPTVVR